MSSVNTAIQLITREQAENAAAGKATATCSPALAKGPWDYDLAEALAGIFVEHGLRRAVGQRGKDGDQVGGLGTAGESFARLGQRLRVGLRLADLLRDRIV